MAFLAPTMDTRYLLLTLVVWKTFVSSVCVSVSVAVHRALSPHVHGVLHDRHVRLALGRRVDGELCRRDDEAFAQWQPHSLSEGVGESGRDTKAGTGAVRSESLDCLKLNLSCTQKTKQEQNKFNKTRKLFKIPTMQLLTESVLSLKVRAFKWP